MNNDYHFVLFEYLCNNTKLSPTEINLFLYNFKLKKLKQNEVFIEKGSTVKWVAFIVSGIMAAINPRECGRKEIHYFIYERNFFSERTGYYDNKPAEQSMIAVKPTNLLYIHIDTLNQIGTKYPNLGYIITKLGEKSTNSTSILQSLLSINSKIERIRQFKLKFPELFKALSGELISCFLNINYSYYLHNANKIN